MLEMKKLGRFLIVAFLSTCAPLASSAAAECYSTGKAMALMRANGITPASVVQGSRAQDLKPPSLSLRTVTFAAAFPLQDGRVAFFFGNVVQVCGPYYLTKEQALEFWRPA